jgi:hypothetical protein
MDEKKVELTDEEIVKALERCVDESMGCVGCPYHGNSCRQMDIDVLDLIHRLQSENEKLKTLVSHFEQLEKQLSAEIERANIRAEIADAGTSCHWCERQTVKEIFTELLKNENVTTTIDRDYWGEEMIISAVLVDKIKEIAKRKGVEVE